MVTTGGSLGSRNRYHRAQAPLVSFTLTVCASLLNDEQKRGFQAESQKQQ